MKGRERGTGRSHLGALVRWCMPSSRRARSPAPRRREQSIDVETARSPHLAYVQSSAGGPGHLTPRSMVNNAVMLAISRFRYDSQAADSADGTTTAQSELGPALDELGRCAGFVDGT